MRTTRSWAAALLMIMSTSAALAEGPKFTVESTLGDLLDNPQAHAILAKYIPDVVNSPQIDQGRALTLHSLQQYVPTLTDETLKQMGDELSKVQ